MSNRISGAPIHLHIDEKLFDLVLTGGIVKADEAAAQHGHTDTHHLPWAEVTVGLSR